MTGGSLLPADLGLGPVRLRVADSRRSGAWLESVLGLERLGEAGGRTIYGAGAGAPLVELREQRGARSVPEGGRPGLYHYALLLPERAALGAFLVHLGRHGIAHADADHLVSEAIYLTDPDGLTVEVYTDRPRAEWIREGERLKLATLPLDHAGLLQAAGERRWERAPEGTRMGHVHLYVGDLAAAERFYVQGMGFDVTSRTLRGALFVSAGGYHHHVGLNTWAAARAPAGPDDVGLDEWTLVVPETGERDDIAQRLKSLGVESVRTPASLAASDPWGITVRVVGSPVR